ncbi:MAG TPA: NEW3 domain-containing protein [Bacillota bacterium]|nr:NEW3 domain-containing protein [Bacillota bacterium]
MWKKMFVAMLTTLVVVATAGIQPVYAQGSLTLFTPYTGLSVTPGESLSYTVDVINDGNDIQNVTFNVDGLPKEWDYSISAGGQNIDQLSIRNGDEQELTLDVEVPLKVDKGEYTFDLVANSHDGTSTTLPFLVNVTKEGTHQTNFSTEQPNMEGHADSDFTYTATLKNQTAEKQRYALSAKEPKGWNVQFKLDGDGVTSVTLDPDESVDIDIEVTPAENVKADTYKIPVQASTGSKAEKLELEAVITGKYDLSLSTPEGKLSADVTAGGKKKVDLVVENTGTADLTDIELSASTPPDWDVTFDEDTVQTLKASEKAKVQATISAPDDAIAGDYVTTFDAKTAEASSEASFRVSVKTSTWWGLVGVAIILAVIGGLYYIFKKYGRR